MLRVKEIAGKCINILLFTFLTKGWNLLSKLFKDRWIAIP